MLNTEHYTITKENLAVHEIIGLNAEVIESSDVSRIGIRGKVIDETKNVFVLESKKGLVKVPKNEAVFEFKIGNEKAVIEGRFLNVRPQERTKMLGGKAYGRM